MRTRIPGVLAGIGLVVASLPALAHHSFSAEFNENKPVRLRGTVVRMDWMNPHCWLHLDVKEPDGKMVRWMVEGGAPNALIRRGWTKRSLLPGTEILVEGWHAKDGSLKMSGRDVRLADGTKLFFDPPTEGPPREKFEITAGWPPDEFDQ